MNLLIGCGNNRVRAIMPSGKSAEFEEGSLITLDINPDRNPDIVHDLNILPLPFEDNVFEEIHAYHVLEHIGHQGDYKEFFAMFSEFWRIMKPGGFFCMVFPRHDNVWALGDPSHVKIVMPQHFMWLSQQFMVDECDVKKTAASDFRYIYDKDFTIEYHNTDNDSVYMMLKAIK